MIKKAQISFEYLIIMGFITFTIAMILGVAFIYSYSTQDRMRETQISNCAEKIVSTAESVYYSGAPSRAVITCYIPDHIYEINATTTEGLLVLMQTSNGVSLTRYPSNVPLYEQPGVSILKDPGQGLRRIKVEAMADKVNISTNF